MKSTYATLFAKYGFTTKAWLQDNHYIITKDITPENTRSIYHLEIKIPADNGTLTITIHKITGNHQAVVAHREEQTDTPCADEAIASVIYITKNIGSLQTIPA